MVRRLSDGFSYDKLRLEKGEKKNVLPKRKPPLPGVSSKVRKEGEISKSAGSKQTHADTK